MVLHTDNSGIVIDGGSIFKAIILLDVLFHIHKAMIVAERKYFDKIDFEYRQMKKQEKLSKKKQKRESK